MAVKSYSKDYPVEDYEMWKDGLMRNLSGLWSKLDRISNYTEPASVQRGQVFVLEGRLRGIIDDAKKLLKEIEGGEIDDLHR